MLLALILVLVKLISVLDKLVLVLVKLILVLDKHMLSTLWARLFRESDFVRVVSSWTILF